MTGFGKTKSREKRAGAEKGNGPAIDPVTQHVFSHAAVEPSGPIG
jgi:hypothetical protein